MRTFFMRLARLWFVLVPMFASAQTDPGPWRFVDPGAKAVISVDWKRVSHSQVGVMLRDKWLDPAGGASIPGIEFLDDVDRFLLSSRGGDPGAETEEAPLLVVVTGRFDLPKIRA